MSVFFTIIVFAVLGLWAIAAHNRLVRLRNQVKRDWKELDASLKSRQGTAAGMQEEEKELEIHRARNTYNNAVLKYNDALQVFPANLLGGLAGFQAANKFEQG